MTRSRLGKKRTVIGSFGGVALADILANGVVVLLVVIIITISFKKQQTEQEIEQSVEISAILARDIASSLVFNDLPSSPPAVLHHYHCVSPGGPWRNEYGRHDCMPWLYPIIELHPDYVREFNSGRIFSRAELLRENNELDFYLSLLSPLEKRHARLDIYAVDLYYLALSILRENGLQPSHWHFMGETAPLPPGGEGDVLSQYGEEQRNRSGPGEGDDGDQEDGSSEEADATSPGDQSSESDDATEASDEIPEDVSLREAEFMEELLPPDDSNTLARGGQERRARADAMSEFAGEEEELGYGDALAEELTRALLEESGKDPFGRPSSISIRLPFGEGDNGIDMLFQMPFQNLPADQEGTIDYHIFMILFLSEYLRRVDVNGFDRLPMDALFQEFLTEGFRRVDADELQFAAELKEKMRIAFQEGEGTLAVESQACFFCLSQLLMQVNLPLKHINLRSIHPETRYVKETDIVNAEMRLFPYPDRGKMTEIFRGDTLLLPRDLINVRRWYPVAILDPNISDVVVGYVYGGQEIVGPDLRIFGDVNTLHLDGRGVSTLLPGLALRRELILGVIYTGSVILILLIFFILIGGWRRWISL